MLGKWAPVPKVGRPVGQPVFEFSQRLDHGHLPVNHFPGQPVTRNPHHNHPPGDRERLNHTDGIAFERQVIGGAQPAGAGPDDTDLPVFIRSLFRVLIRSVRKGPFGCKRLQKLDRNRCVNPAAYAHELTRPGTDQAAHPGKGVIFADHLDGFGIPPQPNQRHVSGNVYTGRTGHLAGGRRQLFTVTGGAIVGSDMACERFHIIG